MLSSPELRGYLCLHWFLGDLEQDHWCWFLLEVGSPSGVDQEYPGCARGFWCWFLLEVGSPSGVDQEYPGCARGFWCWFLLEVGSPSAVVQGYP